MLSLSSLQGRFFHRNDRMAVSFISPVKRKVGRKQGSKLKRVFDESVGRWRTKVYTPEMLAALAAAKDEPAASRSGPAVFESEEEEEDDEGSDNELGMSSSSSAPVQPSMPSSPAGSLVVCEEAGSSFSLGGSAPAPATQHGFPKIKFTVKESLGWSPASPLIMGSTASSSSTLVQKPTKRRRMSPPEMTDAFTTPRQSLRGSRIGASVPPPAPRRPSSSPHAARRPAPVTRTVKRPSAAVGHPAKQQLVKVRSPSPSPSAVSSAASELIVVEEDTSATPATWVPPEASPPPTYASGKLTFHRAAPPSDDSSSSSSGEDDDESEQAASHDYASSDDYAADMLEDPAQFALDWNDASVPPLPLPVDPAPAERTQQQVPTTDEWQKGQWALPRRPVDQSPQAQIDWNGSYGTVSQPVVEGVCDQQRPPISQFNAPHAPDGSRDGLGFRPGRAMNTQAGVQSLVDQRQELEQSSSPPSPPSQTPTVAGPSGSSGSDLSSHALGRSHPVPDPQLDAGLIESLEQTFAAVVEKLGSAQMADVPFEIIDELEEIERSVTVVWRVWKVLARAARDRGDGEALPGGEIAEPLDRIRFWHLTQSALVADLSDRERIHHLLERYYAPTETNSDKLGPDGRIALGKADYRTLSMLVTTLYTYELGREVPGSIGSDIYAIRRLGRLHLERKGEPRIPPPDKIAWPRLGRDMVERARVVLALLPSTEARSPSPKQPPAEPPATRSASQSMDLDFLLGSPDKNEPDANWSGSEGDLSGATLVPSDAPSAVPPKCALAGTHHCAEQREPSPLTHYLGYDTVNDWSFDTYGKSWASGDDDLGGLFQS